jgi:hypothetical protein
MHKKIDYFKYIEAGFSVVYTDKGKKYPQIDWSRFQYTKATEKECAAWSNNEDLGIALVCGQISQIVGIDIDTDDENILALCPASPCIKRGKKGETRFFRWNEQAKSCKRHDLKIEILSDRTISVLPPTIHPDTLLPYSWTGLVALPSHIDELPEFPGVGFIKNIESLFHGEKTKDIGRNNRLVEIASGMIFDSGKSIEEIAEKLLQFDVNIHKDNALFYDEKENKRGATGYENALRFATSVEKSIKKTGRVSIEIEDDEPTPIEKVQLKQFPELNGNLKIISDWIAARSWDPVKPFCDIAAIQLICVFLLGRTKFQGRWPTLNVLLMGDTGLGKEAPQRFIRSVLTSPQFLHYNLNGLAKLVSDVAYSIDFPEQRFRWDCFDEFSAPMREMSKGSNSPVHGAALMLVKIFSINGGFFPGTKAVTRGEKTGRCFAPAVCTMAAIQPDVFVQNVNYEMLANGLLTRFLCVYANEKTTSKKRPKDMNDLYEITDFLKHFFPMSAPIGDGPTLELQRPNPIEINLCSTIAPSKEDSLDGYVEVIRQKCNQRVDDISKSTIYRMMYSRAFEMICILVQPLAWSDLSVQDSYSDKKITVIKKHLDDAMGFVFASIENALLVTGGLSSNQANKVAEEILVFINQLRETGKVTPEKNFIGFKKFYNRFKDTDLKLLNEALTLLDLRGVLTKVTHERKICLK